MTSSFKHNDKSEEKEENILEFNANWEHLLNSREPQWNQWLQLALESYQTLDLSESARFFRKIANDLMLAEQNLSTKGNFSPRNTLNDLTGKQWIRHTKSWVIVDGKPGSLSSEIKNHPASFPPALAEHFISFFTKKGEWVMDPFMGIGSTLAACHNLNRHCFGIELNPIYAQYARDRCKSGQLNPENHQKDTTNTSSPRLEVFTGDARKAIDYWKKEHLPPIKFLITSPPYWNMLKKSRGGVTSSLKKRVQEGYDEFYSESSADLGNIDELEQYLEILTKIFINISPILKDKAHLMIILQNCRPKNGIMQPLAWKLAERLSQNYSLRQEFIWCQDQKYAGIWGYPSTFVSNVHHHYCLVFQKS